MIFTSFQLFLFSPFLKYSYSGPNNSMAVSNCQTQGLICPDKKPRIKVLLPVSIVRTAALDTIFVIEPACCRYSSCEIHLQASNCDTAQWRMTLAAQTSPHKACGSHSQHNPNQTRRPEGEGVKKNLVILSLPLYNYFWHPLNPSSCPSHQNEVWGTWLLAL